MPPATTVPAVVTTADGAPTTTESAPTTTIDTGDVIGFGLQLIALGDQELVVAVADTAALRGRGLMGVEGLGSLDGMLFSWGGEMVTSGFYMKNTLVPLTIAFYAPDGSLVDSLRMVPCEADPCETYRASAPYAYAIEFFGDHPVSPDDRLVLDPSSG